MIQIFLALNCMFKKSKIKENVLYLSINQDEEYVAFRQKLKLKSYFKQHGENECEFLFRQYVYWQLFVNDRESKVIYLRSEQDGCGVSHCEWKYCEETKKSKKLYRCKGCQLVTYCCKSHQKKHWKTIHSKQCLRH
eukprot:UN04772